MLKAAEICQNALGHDHIWTAEIFSHIALMYEEQGSSVFYLYYILGASKSLDKEEFYLML